ncbi:hypothetical protein [Nocardiopsis synnemataformans]|uniref:hypothetical protein n=1 Tax=Nocardiopsis synnemataformans TaxID=61305 RepID=UPI003EBED1B4
MTDQPATPDLPHPTEPDLRHFGGTGSFFISSHNGGCGFGARAEHGRVHINLADDDGGANTILSPAQTTLAATELLRINGTDLSEFYITEGAYPALYHVPAGSGEGAEGHLVEFTGGDHSLLRVVQAAADHVCGADDE